MNERIFNVIQELNGLYSPNWTEETKEEFAHILIKECMKMCDETRAQYLSYRKNTWDFDEKNIYAEGEAACDTLKHKMKKQFGVE